MLRAALILMLTAASAIAQEKPYVAPLPPLRMAPDVESNPLAVPCTHFPVEIFAKLENIYGEVGISRWTNGPQQFVMVMSPGTRTLSIIRMADDEACIIHAGNKFEVLDVK